MVKNQRGFALLEILIIILIVAVVGFGGWLFLTRYNDNQDKQTRNSVGETVATIYFNATSNQTTPESLQNVPAAKMDDKSSEVDTKLDYTKLDESNFMICASFSNEGEDFQAPLSLITVEQATAKGVSPKEDTTYWEYNQQGITDAVKHKRGKNCFIYKLESTSGFQNSGGEVCGVQYSWKYNDRELVSVDVSGSIKTVNSEFEGDEKTYYLDSNGGKVFDKSCNEISLEQLKQGDIVSFYYQQDRSEVYAAIIQIQ